MEKVCRLCGEASNQSMYNIFNKNDSGQQLIQLIKQCLPILVYRTDPLSKEICETCYTKLNDYSSFQKHTIDVHDKFKVNLNERIHESPVKLYIDTLEDAYQPESIQITNFRSPRPVRHHACQIKVETQSNSTNTEELINPKTTPALRSIKILTPSLINEKSSESNVCISLQSEDGTVQKKRRLAGPKSKTRFQPPQRFFPSTLLQCALKQINKNYNLTEELSVSDNTSETAMETETSEYSVSRSESQERDDYVYTPDINLMETSIHITTNYFNDDLNIHEPVDCNYCLKSFNNMSDLAYHEIKHIKVDIGPKCDTKEYGYKCKKFVGYYHNYVARQSMNYESPGPVSPPKLREIKVKPTVNPAVKPPVKPTIKPELRPKQIVRKLPVPIPVKVNPWHERTQHVVDDENSLLVPQETPDYVFKIENYEILINGKPFKNMTKEERRSCYKDVMINGIKRKYCSLCRHTFKDNWSIETHYLSDICLYTCKYCGRKFKYQKELFEDHLTLHKGEPINKIFGPTDRKLRFRKRLKKTNRTVFVGQVSIAPKVKPIKMKQLLQKKSVPPIKIKTEPDFPPDVPSSSNSRGRTEPYQAYFCRKCFKVFFNVNEYNKHIRVCNGALRKNSRNSDSNTTTSETCTTPESQTSSRRPVRSCVKEIKTQATDSDADSDDAAPKKSNKKIQETNETGYNCGICCSSFPSKQSRNSHMRIHKGQQQPNKTVLNKVAPKSHMIVKHEPQVSNNIATNLTQDIRLSNLNPAVARLVQNNPHLTIRSFSKSQVERHQQEKRKISIEPQKTVEPPPHLNDSSPEHKIKRVYKCADCEDTFENKSVLYYHKMNSCIVKRHYECAFCRKKFGTYDQYNTHMFYVHPE